MNTTIIPLSIPLKIPIDADASTDSFLVDSILNHLDLRKCYEFERACDDVKPLHEELQRLVELRRGAYNVCQPEDGHDDNNDNINLYSNNEKRQDNNQEYKENNSDDKEEEVNALLQYYCALMDLESRKICKKFGEDFEFHWTCALSSYVENNDEDEDAKGCMPVYSGDLIAYERACILFNVVALNLKNSLFNRRNDKANRNEIGWDTTELKRAYEMYLESASILHRLHEDFSSSYEGTSADLSLEGLQMLEKITMAEGQVVSLEHATRSARTQHDSVKAKIAASAAMLYEHALLLAQRLPSKIGQIWTWALQVNSLIMHSKAEYYESLNAQKMTKHSDRGFGKAIARFSLASSFCVQALNLTSFQYEFQSKAIENDVSHIIHGIKSLLSDIEHKKQVLVEMNENSPNREEIPNTNTLDRVRGDDLIISTIRRIDVSILISKQLFHFEPLQLQEGNAYMQQQQQQQHVNDSFKSKTMPLTSLTQCIPQEVDPLYIIHVASELNSSAATFLSEHIIPNPSSHQDQNLILPDKIWEQLQRFQEQEKASLLVHNSIRYRSLVLEVENCLKHTIERLEKDKILHNEFISLHPDILSMPGHESIENMFDDFKLKVEGEWRMIKEYTSDNLISLQNVKMPFDEGVYTLLMSPRDELDKLYAQSSNLTFNNVSKWSLVDSAVNRLEDLTVKRTFIICAITDGVDISPSVCRQYYADVLKSEITQTQIMHEINEFFISFNGDPETAGSVEAFDSRHGASDDSSIDSSYSATHSSFPVKNEFLDYLSTVIETIATFEVEILNENVSLRQFSYLLNGGIAFYESSMQKLRNIEHQTNELSAVMAVKRLDFDEKKYSIEQQKQDEELAKTMAAEIQMQDRQEELMNYEQNDRQFAQELETILHNQEIAIQQAAHNDESDADFAFAIRTALDFSCSEMAQRTVSTDQSINVTQNIGQSNDMNNNQQTTSLSDHFQNENIAHTCHPLGYVESIDSSSISSKVCADPIPSSDHLMQSRVNAELTMSPSQSLYTRFPISNNTDYDINQSLSESSGQNGLHPPQNSNSRLFLNSITENNSCRASSPRQSSISRHLDRSRRNSNRNRLGPRRNHPRAVLNNSSTSSSSIQSSLSHSHSRNANSSRNSHADETFMASGMSNQVSTYLNPEEVVHNRLSPMNCADREETSGHLLNSRQSIRQVSLASMSMNSAASSRSRCHTRNCIRTTNSNTSYHRVESVNNAEMPLPPIDDIKVQSLVSMGFDTELSMSALSTCNNHLDDALNLLLEGMNGT